MFVLAVCVSMLCVDCSATRDTTTRAVIDTLRSAPAVSPSDDTLLVTRADAMSLDTVPVPRRKRVVAVEYSDWYGRRLTIHRWASYATLPLFVGNYVTGQQLLSNGNLAPSWALRTHGPLATSVATLFAVNTLTGGWNLWEGREDPSARAWRFTHAFLMLGADAGFTAAGVLSKEAQRSDQRRQLHRTVALTSIGMSLVSYVMMLSPFRRD